MKLPLFIGGRYAGFRHDERYLSFVSVVSFLGLLLGVLALTVVVSVMNGFDRELKHRILGVVPHLVLESVDISSAKLAPGVTAVTRFTEAGGMVLADSGSRLFAIYGVDVAEEPSDSVLSASLQGVSLTALTSAPSVILGVPAARSLALEVGDGLSLILPGLSEAGKALRPKIIRVRLAGTFKTGSELDHTLALMSVDQLAKASGNPVSLRLTLEDVFAAPGLAAGYEAEGYGTRNWTAQHGDFFEAVRMEKIMMFVLLSFVVAVAAFGIVAGLSMMVDSKRADIAVLRTLGLPVHQVVMIFVAQGMLIALAGISAGILLGVPVAYQAPELMAFVERTFGASIIEGTYFDRIPVDVRLPDIVAIAVTSGLISLAASIYPACRAALLDPSAILRYE